MNVSKINSLYSQIIGGDATHKEKEKALYSFMKSENLTLAEIENELAYSASIIYAGEVMDGNHDS